MIDIHCHILPGVDDGARSLEDSIEMAREASAQGIRKIVATPHHRNGQFYNIRADIINRVTVLNRNLQELNIPVEVLPGQETRIHGDIIEGIRNKEILAVNIDTPYLLIELPTSTVPKYTNKLFFDLQVEGFIPVIVHPERNSELISRPEKLYEMVKNGALTQVTAGSLLGKFGKKIRKFSHEIVQANLSHFIASDAHNVHSRGFVIHSALDEIKSHYGDGLIYNYCENAKKMIAGETIVGDYPEEIIRRKLFKIF